MAEELDIPGTLAKIEAYDLNPIERVLAVHTGTVQLLLSLYFGEPVDVVVEEQREGQEAIFREVALVLRTSRSTVCRASSVIPLAKNRRQVLEDVRRGELGIGQIAVKHHIQTERELTQLAVDQEQIVRTYTMTGPALHYQVTETFPRELYNS